MTGVSADMDGVVPPARELSQAALEQGAGWEIDPFTKICAKAAAGWGGHD
jgi:hypothetical protein